MNQKQNFFFLDPYFKISIPPQKGLAAKVRLAFKSFVLKVTNLQIHSINIQ